MPTDAETGPLAHAVLESILESSDDAIIGKDLNGIITSWNAAATHIFGYTAQEMLGQSNLRLIPAQRLAEDQQILASLRAGQQVRHLETTRLSKSGQLLEILMSASPIRDAAGKLVGVCKIARDVTRRKLLQSQYFLGLLESAMDAIISVDASMHIIHFNPAASQIFGVSVQDALGQPLENFMPTRFRDAHPQYVAAFGTGSQTTRSMGRLGQVVGLRCNGEEFPAEASISHIDSGGYKIYTVILRDVTERQKVTDALQQSLREKEALIKEVHHRVKNNLQVVTSLLHLESGRTALAEVRAVLRNTGNRIQSISMVHELLYRSGSLACVDLGNYIGRLATQTLQSLLEADSRIVLKLDLVPVEISMDQAVSCGLVVSELLSNCVKHAFPDTRGGEVCIELQPVGESGHWRLCVRDTGVGLPADFEARQRDSLGMQLVGDLVKQIKGQLEIGQANASGARFTVTFPLTALNRRR